MNKLKANLIIKNKRTIVSSLFLLLFTLGVNAKGAAGMVLYFNDGHQTFLLLADDIEGTRGWSAFGGRQEEGESIIEAAARETSEETRGFYSKEWLMLQVEGQTPVSTSNGFKMFFVEVPFVPALRIKQHPLPYSADKHSQERVHFAWVPLSNLEQAIHSEKNEIIDLYLPPSSKLKFYWDVWIKNMKDAYAINACPWQKLETLDYPAKFIENQTHRLSP